MAKKTFTVLLHEKWCKGCAICVAFCPSKGLSIGVNGKLRIDEAIPCRGCGVCQLRCPDYAIEVKEVK